MQMALKIWNKVINKKEPGAMVQEGKLKITDRMTSDTFTRKAHRAWERDLLLLVKKEIPSEWQRWTDITCYENNERFNCGDFSPMGFIIPL